MKTAAKTIAFSVVGAVVAHIIIKRFFSNKSASKSPASYI